MAYIGNTVQTVPYYTDTFSGTGAQTNFNLTRAPAGSAAIAVFISGSYQSPANYTVTGTLLTFGSAPASGTNNVVVLHLGTGSAVQVTSDGSVTLTKLSGDTYAYINSAFSAANTGSSGATSAGIYANTAFSTANSAGTYANAAFGTANSAGSYANSSFSSANSGFAVANSAAIYANSAFLRANTPSATANSAAIYANGAFVQANTAASTGKAIAMAIVFG